MENGWKMEDGKWSYRQVRRALVWTHSFRGGVFGRYATGTLIGMVRNTQAVSQVSTRPVGTCMHTHRAA